MSLNRRNGDRNRDRCHGIVEIVTDVEMAIVPPISPTCSCDKTRQVARYATCVFSEFEQKIAVMRRCRDAVEIMGFATSE